MGKFLATGIKYDTDGYKIKLPKELVVECEEEEEEEYEDVNGRIIKVGDRVYWDDEAGVEEDGTKIVFIVDEADGNGYFNIHTDDEDFADRWAYYNELEVIE